LEALAHLGLPRNQNVNPAAETLDDGFGLREGLGMRDMCIEFNSSDAEPIPPGLFFTLPSQLLSTLEKYLGTDRFDAALWQKENRLAAICTVGDIVGFWRCQFISYDLLRPKELRITSDDVAGYGWTADQIEAVNVLGASRVERFENVSRSYAGWLLTNATFLAEHRDLLNKWQNEVAEYGIPKMGPVVRNGCQVPMAVVVEVGRLADCIQEFENFFVRWRLQGMPAPFLPYPLQPQLPVPVLEYVLGHMRHGGQTFYLPDTFPVPSRDELREIMEDALRGSEAPEHLADWMQIVRASNPSRNALGRFARLLAVQHYWRAIFERHGGQLRRARGLVGEALAEFLGTSPETIRDDLSFISERLGYEWDSQAE
jgi:hypothetical protein